MKLLVVTVLAAVAAADGRGVGERQYRSPPGIRLQNGLQSRRQPFESTLEPAYLYGGDQPLKVHGDYPPRPYEDYLQKQYRGPLRLPDGVYRQPPLGSFPVLPNGRFRGPLLGNYPQLPFADFSEPPNKVYRQPPYVGYFRSPSGGYPQLQYGGYSKPLSGDLLPPPVYPGDHLKRSGRIHRLPPTGGYPKTNNTTSTPKPYSFSYGVLDVRGNDFGAAEKSNGEEVQGQYSVLLPDGRLQTVSYSVQGDSGFVADVTYEGEAKLFNADGEEEGRSTVETGPVPTAYRDHYGL